MLPVTPSPHTDLNFVIQNSMGRAGFAPATQLRLFYRELPYSNRRADPETERTGFEPAMELPKLV